ncbi:MAG: hypothetical protein ACRBBN_01140 [Methyloligellaceae bacterium]
MFSISFTEHFLTFLHDLHKSGMGRASDNQPDPLWTAIAYIASFIFGICFWLGVIYLLFYCL